MLQTHTFESEVSWVQSIQSLTFLDVLICLYTQVN